MATHDSRLSGSWVAEASDQEGNVQGALNLKEVCLHLIIRVDRHAVALVSSLSRPLDQRFYPNTGR